MLYIHVACRGWEMLTSKPSLLCHFGLLPERDVQYRRGVGRQCRGQRTEGDTQRQKERGARCAAKVPGVIDVMAVYPSCCVATA